MALYNRFATILTLTLSLLSVNEARAAVEDDAIRETAGGPEEAANPTAVPPSSGAPADALPPTSEPQQDTLPMLEGGVVEQTVVVSPVSARVPQDLASGSQRALSTQRSLAFYATALTYEGFGLGIRAGFPRLGLDLSAGYRPVIFGYSQESDQLPEFKYLGAFQQNVSVFVGLHRTPRSDVGFSLGYKYNTVLLHGFGAAFYVRYDLAEHWALLLNAGPAFFPRAEAELRKAAHLPEGGSVASGLSALQGGFSVGLAFFP